MSKGSARQHAQWISLIDRSGPFLALEVLSGVFPQGLPHSEAQTEIARRLRVAHSEWLAEFEAGGRKDPAIHRAWVELVLTEVLEWPKVALSEGQAVPTSLAATLAEHGETLRPDVVLNQEGKPRLLVAVWPADQDLEKPVKDRRSALSPATRMMSLLHATDVRLGLVTNGDAWMLVHAKPGETTTYATWWAEIWRSEALTLTAFRALLGAEAFFGRPADESLEALFEKSADYAHEVTDRLGLQVRRAVEMLVHAIDRLDRDEEGALLAGVDDKALYESAVTVMMRLVFLLCAEERKLLLAGNALWDEHYAVSTLREQLRSEADRYGEEVLSRRRGAWARLLATFRAVYGGVRHEDFQLRPYGGSIFDPDRFPFLERRPKASSWREHEAQGLRLDDRTVLHMLDAIQVLQLKGELVRLSFRSLDVEQIGHVYEGLLDHTAVRATTPVLGLIGKNEPEVPLADLQREQKREGFVEWLGEQTGVGIKALSKNLTYEEEDLKLPSVCESDDLYQAVKPFTGLLRRDSSGYPVVYVPGARYVTVGSDRRSTGTHYTPRSLTEPIVQHALEPLVYDGPAEGKPPEEWKLKGVKELLSLRVCDIAMGSGAFLVAACRYLADRLDEAWSAALDESHGLPLFVPVAEAATGQPTERLVPADRDERRVLARRVVADRCLYGVDRNPMAVEMAKLSLWLTTLQKDRPFTFLDHALKCGDSLLGITSFKQLENFDLRTESGGQKLLGSAQVQKWMAAAAEQRERLERIDERDIKDTEKKAFLHAQAEKTMRPAKVIADLIVGASLATPVKQLDSRLAELAMEANGALDARASRDAREDWLARLGTQAFELINAGRESGHAERPPFHWPLEFPEVFTRDRSGFDALVGNPPYVGGSRISTELGTTYNEYLKTRYSTLVGKIDLVVFFLWRGLETLSPSGILGFVTTFRLPDGDNGHVGIRLLLDLGWRVFRADRNDPWPGDAKVRISKVWIGRASAPRASILDGALVKGIGFDLREPVATAETASAPRVLAANAAGAFQGANPDSLGFMLSDEERRRIILERPSEAQVIRRYIVGNDLNSRASRDGSRWIIDFSELSLEQATEFAACLAIVRERVLPSRMSLKRKSYRERWWQFTEPQEEAHRRAREHERVLGISRVTKFVLAEWIDTASVVSAKIVMFITDSEADAAILNSIVHEAWAWKTSGRFGAGDSFSYSHTRTFNTFPRPRVRENLKNRLSLAGATLALTRAECCVQKNVGLTELYSRAHELRSADLANLRERFVEVNQATLTAYGWDDLAAKPHDFYETPLGTRFTLEPKATTEMLDRLLELNHQLYAEEEKAGLHENKSKAAAGKRQPGSKAAVEAPASATKDLFDP